MKLLKKTESIFGHLIHFCAEQRAFTTANNYIDNAMKSETGYFGCHKQRNLKDDGWIHSPTLSTGLNN